MITSSLSKEKIFPISFLHVIHYSFHGKVHLIVRTYHVGKRYFPKLFLSSIYIQLIHCYGWTFCNLILTNQSRDVELELIYSSKKSPLHIYISTEEGKKPNEEESERHIRPASIGCTEPVYIYKKKGKRKKERITSRRYICQRNAL